MERTNARYLSPEQFEDKADVALISLEKILPVLPPLVKPQGRVVALIKPQFEAGKETGGKERSST